MAFSSISADSSVQFLALAQEVATAYNKRCYVCGHDLYDVAEGSDCYQFFYNLQSGIENLVGCFGSKNQTLAGQTAFPVQYADIAAGMTDAGLTQAGYWRRLPQNVQSSFGWQNYTESCYSYGRVQNGDIMGPWLWQDLMTALSGLTRMVKYSYAYDTYHDSYDRYVAVTDPYTMPSWEGIGTPDLTIKPIDDFSAYAVMSVEKKRNSNDEDLAHAQFCNLKESGAYIPINGLGSCDAKIVSLIGSTSTDVFPSITGWTNDMIGKTVVQAATLNADNNTAYAWVFKSPDAFTHTWANITALMPWANCTNERKWYGRYFNVSDSCLVLDYDFSDGSNS